MNFVSQALLAFALIGSIIGVSPAAAGAPAKPNIVTCTPIAAPSQLSAIRRNLAGRYCLTKDIDLSSVSNFVPIGSATSPFTGAVFGNGHIIRNLKISSAGAYVALFGAIQDAVIQDLGLIDVTVIAGNTGGAAFAAGLVAKANTNGGITTIARVFVTGRVTNNSRSGDVGGIVGESDANTTLTDSWSSADVVGPEGPAGGAVGDSFGLVTNSYATGNVSCVASRGCFAGGLVGFNQGAITQSYATGPVSGITAGGLVGSTIAGTIHRAYATGPVSADGGGGGLVGNITAPATIAESYATGPVTAATNAGGLVGIANSSPTVTNSYWDKNTTGQATSAAGTPETTVQLRSALPQGFGSGGWAISPNLSFPFLNNPDIDFTSPLATLVRTNKVFIFLPISQLDKSLYAGATAHISQASQATVYDMIARAIGLTDNVAQLKEVRIDKYFWHDAKQTTTWTGPVLTHATLGKFVALAPSATLNPVLAQMKVQNLVILRGSYTTNGGGTATHWMLGTMYLGDVVVANDPWTGTQVSISVRTRKVTDPASFPLANFKVDGYQAVTVN